MTHINAGRLPNDRSPALQLPHRGRKSAGVEPVPGEGRGYVFGAGLDLIALLGRDEHGEDCRVERRGRLRRRLQDLQVRPFVDVELALGERAASPRPEGGPGIGSPRPSDFVTVGDGRRWLRPGRGNRGRGRSGPRLRGAADKSQPTRSAL